MSLDTSKLKIMDQLETNINMGGLKGKALKDGKYFPQSKNEVYQHIPKHLVKKDTVRSLKYAAISVALTLMAAATGFFIPQTLAYAPVWFIYGAVTGTIATGCWVIAHECGHQAFSDNKTI
jgi:fatty acid desaturase